jgi:hypothetical protein
MQKLITMPALERHVSVNHALVAWSNSTLITNDIQILAIPFQVFLGQITISMMKATTSSTNTVKIIQR